MANPLACKPPDLITRKKTMDEMMNEPAMAEEMGEESSGYTICIRVGADGKVSVGVEDNKEEDAEGYALQPVKSIGEAMQVAMDIYKNDGMMDDMAASDDEFNKGFGQNPKGAM